MKRIKLVKITLVMSDCAFYAISGAVLLKVKGCWCFVVRYFVEKECCGSQLEAYLIFLEFLEDKI